MGVVQGVVLGAAQVGGVFLASPQQAVGSGPSAHQSLTEGKVRLACPQVLTPRTFAESP